jgi:hypothetical protein
MANAWTGISTAPEAFCFGLWKILPGFETYSNLALLTYVSKKVSEYDLASLKLRGLPFCSLLLVY